jgi:hypothetical protein
LGGDRAQASDRQAIGIVGAIEEARARGVLKKSESNTGLAV